MQDIIIAKPYQFVPPVDSLFWSYLLSMWMPGKVRRGWGVGRPEYRGIDLLRASIAAGHGVLIAPNHCRPADPEVVGLLCITVRRPPYMMASWHLFMQGQVQRFLLRRAGIFSIYREGIDREALRAASQYLATARRPLVIFPEGVISRANDRLGHLMEGTAFIARSAAKLRAKAEPPGKVVLHPVALHYFYDGDLRATVEPVLTRIEKRLGWRPQRDLKLVPRVIKLGEGLLSVREIEFYGRAQPGSIHERLPRLIEHILGPLEQEYRVGKLEKTTIDRVRRLRMEILPALVTGELSESDRAQRWRQLADCYFAQQLACYPIDYLAGTPTVERILETVERFDEDLTDTATIHRPLRCVIRIDPAIPVEPDRPRGGDGDPLMKQLRERLLAMLTELAAEARVWQE